MRCAILADIHGNLAAFQAVLEDLRRRGAADCIWCLGDTVGYGPYPRECIALLRQHDHLCVAGNHDWAAAGRIDTSQFNPDAAAATRWTAERLTPDEVEYLGSLPLTLRQGDFTLVHGSPREPIWEYVLSVRSAEENFGHFETRFCLIGHSHAPLLFEMGREGDCQYRQLPGELPLDGEGKRLIINCGSVGQPRDGDPRASYAILDTEASAVQHHRIIYDIATTQQSMRQARLSARLINRLSLGW
jgi:diadenosine tetraphosphatase ApaH/serine/threonine PP2A family protein phosphatase